MKNKLIFSKNLVNYLAKRGIYYFSTKPDAKMPQYDVYIYEDTDVLRKAIAEYNKQPKALQ